MPPLEQRFSKAVHSCLCCCIVCLSELAFLPVYRADVYHASPPFFQHAVDNKSGHVENRAKVRVHHLIPLLKGHLTEG